MPRRVPVILDLDARGYITSAVKATEATKAMDAQMGALDREVDKVDRDMAELAATTEAAKHQVDDLGDEARGTAADLKLLESRIAAARAQARALGLEFARTGDATAMTERRKELSLAAQLERLRKEVEKADGGGGLGVTLGSAAGTKAGQGFASGFTEQLSGLGGKARPILIATLVGAAVAAAPTIGAMLAGGISGAFGTGAMAAGILSAAKDPRVQAAAQEFGHSISDQFFGGGEAFVEPVIDALDILEQAFTDMHVPDALAKMAPTVTVIAEGFADFGRNVMPGVNKALDRMGPFAAVAAEGFADMGDTLGDFVDDVTESRGSLEGLEALFRLVNGTVRILGVSINFLSARFHEWNFLQAKAFGASRDIADALGLDKAADGAGRLARMFERTTGIGGDLHGMFRKIGPEAVDPFTAYLKHAREEMERLAEETAETNRALTDYFNITMSLDQAQLGVNQGLLDLKEALKENGRHWEDNTRAGLANREALLRQIESVERLREAEIAAGGDAKQANAAYYAQVTALLAIAKQGGATKEVLDKLEREYIIRFSVNQGLFDLLNKIRSALWGGGGGGGQTNTGRPIGEHAAGGPLLPGVPYLVGERGPEIAMFGQSGQMYSNQQSAAMARQWSGGAASGGGRYVIENHITLVDPMTGEKTRKMLITDARNRGKPSEVVETAYP